MNAAPMDDRTLFRRWLRATSLGWVLGIPVIAGLALVGEAIGIGGAQGIVGVGMGASVGLLQARALRDVLPRAANWFWASVVALGVPFLGVDILGKGGVEFDYSLQLSVMIGGALAGLWQAYLLRGRIPGMQWWLLGSVAGWSLAAGMVGLADLLFRSHTVAGVPGLVAYLGLMAGGGVVLGAVTAYVLVRAPRGA